MGLVSFASRCLAFMLCGVVLCYVMCVVLCCVALYCVAFKRGIEMWPTPLPFFFVTLGSKVCMNDGCLM